MHIQALLTRLPIFENGIRASIPTCARCGSKHLREISLKFMGFLISLHVPSLKHLFARFLHHWGCLMPDIYNHHCLGCWGLLLICWSDIALTFCRLSLWASSASYHQAYYTDTITLVKCAHPTSLPYTSTTGPLFSDPFFLTSKSIWVLLIFNISLFLSTLLHAPSTSLLRLSSRSS